MCKFVPAHLQAILSYSCLDAQDGAEAHAGFGVSSCLALVWHWWWLLAPRLAVVRSCCHWALLSKDGELCLLLEELSTSQA